MSISTYFRPNIYQNGHEILGVNATCKLGSNGFTKFRNHCYL
jgi:hypothetical protein